MFQFLKKKVKQAIMPLEILESKDGRCSIMVKSNSTGRLRFGVWLVGLEPEVRLASSSPMRLHNEAPLDADVWTWQEKLPSDGMRNLFPGQEYEVQVGQKCRADGSGLELFSKDKRIEVDLKPYKITFNAYAEGGGSDEQTFQLDVDTLKLTKVG